MAKRPLLLLLGITHDLAFAAGCLLQSLRRHSPALGADILLYTDDRVLPRDAELLGNLGVRLVPFTPPKADLDPVFAERFSPLALSRLDALRLLADYATVLWLDVDIAVQDDISPLLSHGPFAAAYEDPSFNEAGRIQKAGINLLEPVPGYDSGARNYNSGVLVFTDNLPDPEKLYGLCMLWLRRNGPACRYTDQAVINMLAQHLWRHSPQSLALIPHDQFNAHPRNPVAAYAALVHAFGPYKFWQDGRLLSVFPEWARDYARWLALGGSPFQGCTQHADVLADGPLGLLQRLQTIER